MITNFNTYKSDYIIDKIKECIDNKNKFFYKEIFNTLVSINFNNKTLKINALNNLSLYYIKIENNKIYLNYFSIINKIFENVNDLIIYLNKYLISWYIKRCLNLPSILNINDNNINNYIDKIIINNENLLTMLKNNVLPKEIINKYKYLLQANNFDLI